MAKRNGWPLKSAALGAFEPPPTVAGATNAAFTHPQELSVRVISRATLGVRPGRLALGAHRAAAGHPLL
jgi:hypothetical protein